MVMTGLRRLLAPLLLSLLLVFSAGCAAFAPEAPSPFSEVQEETSGRDAPAAVAVDAVKGGQLNDYFPRSVAGYGDYSVVPAQEKQGFAQFKVNQGGENVAMLSINDTVSNPAAATKYQSSSRQIEGNPALDIGNNGTGVLVGDRFQVKVQSRADSFTAEDREAWLKTFDYRGLANLAGQ